ncbi:LysR family transcriptional regulator, partial [Streptomyces sp. SID11233]|nr:LysR family transcriptional regulator [Streptomyces sp. SID11233]
MAEFTLTGLRVVHQVAAAGSFTRAAELLGYTQSAVSRQVAS